METPKIRGEGEEREEMISDEEFERQFKVQEIDIEGHKVRFVEIKPPETITDQYIVYIRGFLAGEEVYRHEIENLAKSGRNILYLNPVKGLEADNGDRVRMEEFEIPETIQSKATEVTKLLHHLGISRADFVGHSQGAVVGAVAADLRPGIADSLVLSNPAGLIGDDTVPRMVGRTGLGWLEQQNAVRKEADPEERARLKPIQEWAVKGAESDSLLWRWTKEISGIAKVDILPILQSIKRRQADLDGDKLTTISLISANNDRTFPHKRIESHIGLPSDPERSNEVDPIFETTLDMYATYAREKATHDAPVYEKLGLLNQILNEKFRSK